MSETEKHDPPGPLRIGFGKPLPKWPFRNVPPAIAELFKLLPEPGTKFARNDRINFLKACAAIFDLVYGRMPPIAVDQRRPTLP